MIKAKDLRIGNLIATGTIFKETSNIGKVLSIGLEECEFEQIYCECEESFEWFFKDNFCGIPLTEEWLIKFGFKKIITPWEYFKGETIHYQNEFCWVYLLGECFEIEINTLCERHNLARQYKYVHELQNIHYSITNQELTIKF